MTPPSCTIIIPNFNGRQYLEVCLPSIKRQTHGALHTIVVDNGSTDGSVPWLKQWHPYVEVVALEANQGFSRAVNMGIRAAGTDYVVLLNNDTELDADFISEGIGALERHPEYDVVAPKMVAYHDRKVLDGAGDGVFRGGAGYRLGTKERDSAIFNTPREVFGACAGAAFYRRTFFAEAGFFDESFFAYLEDVDLNHRANSLGMKTLYWPAAVVYHMGSATTGSSLNAFTVRQTTRNLVGVIVKNYPAQVIRKFALAIMLYQLWWFLVALKGGHVAAHIQGWGQALKQLPQSMRKRRQNLKQVKVGPDQYARLIRNAETQVLMSIRRRREKRQQMVWPLRLYGKL